MDENLPVLMLGEKHQKLLLCMQEYPYITEVFQNIFYGRPLDSNIQIREMKTLDLYINDFFIPLLLQHEVIVCDKNSPNGFRALVSAMRSSPDGMSRRDIADFALMGMKDIVDGILPHGDPKNDVCAYVHGEYSPEFCERLVATMRSQATEVLHTPSTTDENRKKIKLAIAVKIEDKRSAP